MERIPFKDLRKIVKKFLNSKRIDELILSSLLLKLSRGLSFRDLREELRDRIKEETLDLLLEYVRREIEESTVKG
ncbi:MAG: hypothetical protein C0196_05665 [Dictyoglomus turgidum]|jgi:hypothetical protein|nr:MAG: hypothetical protein C0196_05665 [Dictyoglomus turgidum]